jgi:phosphatidylglycerophosphate synthase
VEQQVVAGSLRRLAETRRPDVADALTLSRGVAAAWLAAIYASGIRDRKGLAGILGWGALLWGETVSDWLDGPLARRRGGTALGRMLDLEADSWLTLWAALAAARWGDLPPWIVAAPALRYLPLLSEARPVSGVPAGAHARWGRAIGVAQMAIISGALCPWPLGPLRAQARRAAAPIAVASLACRIAQERAWRRLRATAAPIEAARLRRLVAPSGGNVNPTRQRRARSNLTPRPPAGAQAGLRP